jgi:hypothetical protein
MDNACDYCPTWQTWPIISIWLVANKYSARPGFALGSLNCMVDTQLGEILTDGRCVTSLMLASRKRTKNVAIETTPSSLWLGMKD